MRCKLPFLAIVLFMVAEDVYVEAIDNLFRDGASSRSKGTKGSKTSRKHLESDKSSSLSKGVASKSSFSKGKASKRSFSKSKASKNSKSKKSSHQRWQEPQTREPTPASKPDSPSNEKTEDDVYPTASPSNGKTDDDEYPSVSPTCLECDDGPNQMKTEQPVTYVPDTLTDDSIGKPVITTASERPQELEPDSERSDIFENSERNDTAGSVFQEPVSLLALGIICMLSWLITM